MELNPFKDILFRYILVRSYCGENRVQRPESQRRGRRNCDPMGHWLPSLQNDVAPNLMDPFVSPAVAEVLDEFLTA
jgi:hypothetical protein